MTSITVFPDVAPFITILPCSRPTGAEYDHLLHNSGVQPNDPDQPEILMNDIMQTFNNASPMFWVTLIPLVLFIWFLPVILAAFFNRPHLKYIAIAAVPAGLSFIAWGALIVWACSGKVSGRFNQWFEKQQGRP